MLLLAACADVGDAPAAQTGDAVAVTAGGDHELAIDTLNSTINFKAAKVTRRHDGGFHSFTGTISQKAGHVSGVRVLIDTRTVWTDTPRLTNHLKSDDFFDVELYPEAIFEADQFVAVDSVGATHLVTGNLSMHGITHGITFPASITVRQDSVLAVADFIINRRLWEINYTGPANDLVEDNVRLLLDIAAPASSGTD